MLARSAIWQAAMLRPPLRQMNTGSPREAISARRGGSGPRQGTLLLEMNEQCELTRLEM